MHRTPIQITEIKNNPREKQAKKTEKAIVIKVNGQQTKDKF